MTDAYTLYFGLQAWKWFILAYVTLLFGIASLPDFDQTNRDDEVDW